MPFKKLNLKEPETGPDYATINPREIAIARLLPLGLTNRQISEELHISERTVQTHLVNLYAKCQLGNRTAVVVRLLKEGFIKLEDIKLNPDVSRKSEGEGDQSSPPCK